MRTDLGGLYFNVWFLLGRGVAYLSTGQGLFLLVVLVLQLEMLQQLIPAVRFDGYYVLADLAGVPDLFARVRPVLRSLRAGAPADPRVTELRPAARRLVAGWVLVVVPLLTARVRLAAVAPAGHRPADLGGASRSRPTSWPEAGRRDDVAVVARSR